MKFKNYAKAQEYQLSEWVAGRPWHNPWSPCGDINGECCPDFSCCNTGITPKAAREAFAKADNADRLRMLLGFLGNALNSDDEEPKVYVGGDPDIEESGSVQ